MSFLAGDCNICTEKRTHFTTITLEEKDKSEMKTPATERQEKADNFRKEDLCKQIT